MIPTRTLTASLVILLVACPALAVETLTRGSDLAVDAASDGRLAFNLAGDIWVVPPGGGEARRITRDARAARRPRWSPDGERIAYVDLTDGSQGIRVYDIRQQRTTTISSPGRLDLHPAWHPDGERLTYASDRTGRGFDLWETDIQTGLEWRLTSRAGDETDPAWSDDGGNLVYVHHEGDTWSLVLRPFGQPEEILLATTDRLAAPSWRPDGSLVSFFRVNDEDISLEIVILSKPRLVRRYASGEAFLLAPVSWRDRQQMVYAADGRIRERMFDAWASKTIHFRANVASETVPGHDRIRRTLPRVDEPDGRLVIRAWRLFDGVGNDYATARDIVIERGRIAAIEDRAERPGEIVIDMGDLTVLPGLIDTAARLPDDAGEGLGPLLLATGLTTLLAPRDDAAHLDTIWSGKAMPGPRLLPADDWAVSAFSGLADSTTPGLPDLLRSRQARLLGMGDTVARRFMEPPRLDRGVTEMVLGSRPSGLPAGIGLHAELRALVAAGLRPVQALRAAGVNAAAELGVDPALGRIAVGAAADLVLVDGDPLADVADAINVVAVVRNGRFYSVAGLIDRVDRPEIVE